MSTEKTNSDWKSLPVEVLYKIFKTTTPLQPKICYARICKAWKTSAQKVFYTNVTIYTQLQLKQFYSTMQLNPNLGYMVKTLYLGLPANQTNNEVIKIMSSLLSTFLPNLQVLREAHPHSYVPTLNALLDSRLNHLEVIEPPKAWIRESEVSNYITCACLMKDRLKNVKIADNFSFAKERINQDLFLDRIYDRLDQFGTLMEIEISRKTSDEILILEHIIEICKSLNKIIFNFSLPDGEADLLTFNNNIPIDSISKYIPASNIKVLQSYVNVSDDYKILLYMMHKFTQLEQFHLIMKQNYASQFDLEMLSRLLTYVSNIDDFTLYDLRADQDIITRAIGNYWEAKAKPGNERLEIIYSERFSRGITNGSLGLSKKSGKGQTTTTLTYCESESEWRHIAFIEDNGKFIGEVQFSFLSSTAPFLNSSTIPETFIPDVLLHCPNLHYLRLDSCIMKRFAYSQANLGTKTSLDKLHLTNSVIYDGALEQLSLWFSEIDQLCLNGSTCCIKEVESEPDIDFANPLLEIVMPYTKINTIVFNEVKLEKIVFIKLFVTTTETFHYYRCHSSELIYELSAMDFLDATEASSDQQIYVHCPNEPRFLFQKYSRV